MTIIIRFLLLLFMWFRCPSYRNPFELHSISSAKQGPLEDTPQSKTHPHTHTHPHTPPPHTHTHTHTQKGDRDRKSALDVRSSSASVSPFSALGHREQGPLVLNLLSPATCKQLQTPVLSLGLDEGEQNSIHDLWSWRLPFSLFK